MRCPAANCRRPGHPLRRQAAKDNGSLIKSVRRRGFGKNARTGETHTQEPWFFMASWDMASAPVCTALFTILGGAVNRAIDGLEPIDDIFTVLSNQTSRISAS